MAQVQTVYGMAADVKSATVAAVAAGKGRVFTPTYATADKGGWCQREVIIDRVGEAHWSRGPDGARVREPSRTLSMRVRCRRCDGCLKERRCMWAKRAEREFQQAALRGGRTWFLTNTFRPEEHYRLLTMTRQRLAGQGMDFDALPWRDRYREQLVEYHGEVTLFLARLRKGLRKRDWKRIQFRYLAVPEPHASGYLHYHMLVHEADADQRIVKLRIEEAWRGGFLKAKLVESADACRYVTKYLGKHHFEGRLRNSHGYGDVPAEIAEAEARAKPDLRDWLYQRDCDPEAWQKSDVEDLRIPFGDEPEYQTAKPAVATHRYGDDSRKGDEMRQLLEPAVPPLQLLPRKTDDLSGVADAAVRRALVEDEADPESEVLRAGDEMGVCPAGLHIGSGCGCGEQPATFACTAEDRDEYRGGIPRRRWALRGWHEAIPGRGAPGLPRPDRVAAMQRGRQRQ